MLFYLLLYILLWAMSSFRVPSGFWRKDFVSIISSKCFDVSTSDVLFSFRPTIRSMENVSYKYGVHPKMSPSISFSGMYRKIFILCRTRTNLWYRAHVYFSTRFFCLRVRPKTGLSTIRSILDTHLFSNFVIMTFDYDFCCVLVQKLK